MLDALAERGSRNIERLGGPGEAPKLDDAAVEVQLSQIHPDARQGAAPTHRPIGDAEDSIFTYELRSFKLVCGERSSPAGC